MNIPDTRAAVKRSPKSDDDRVYVHAVLLEDPMHRMDRETLRRLKFRREPVHLDNWEAPDAICSRRVRLVYPMSFHADDDNVCPDCKQLMTILRLDREQYPEQARLIEQRVHEHERRKREHERRREDHQDAHQQARRIVEGVDEFYEDEPSPDLLELLRRVDRDDPDASDTA